MFLSGWSRRTQRKSRITASLKRPQPRKRATHLRVEQLEARILLNASDQQFVLRLYDDLLERTADPSGLQHWTSLLGQGASRTQVAAGFLGSVEHQVQLIGNTYVNLLKRLPDPHSWEVWLNFLQGGGRSDQLKADILGSAEYFSDSGSTTNGFLVSIYHDVLGRPIDPYGLAAFTKALESGITRTQVAAVIVNSPEARGVQLDILYVRFLDRQPDSAGLQSFQNALEQGATLEAVEAVILGSTEYFNDFVATPGIHLTDGAALALPGVTGQTVKATFTASGVNSAYANEFGIFPVNDATGRIGTLEPGDPGYEAAALSEPGSRVVFAQSPVQAESATVNLPGGSFLGLYLVANGTTAEALANNPDGHLGQSPFVYFSFARANLDRFEHIHQTGNQFAFEDLFGGGLYNFNNLQVTVAFSLPQPPPTSPPVVTLTSPPNGLLTRQNATVSGQAVDDQSGVASIEAVVDGGSPFPISFNSSGKFSFTTSLPLDGSADGQHAVKVQARDKAGNLSAFTARTFTLDTVPPTVNITGPTTALTTKTNVTITGQATDVESGVAQVEEEIDGGAFTPVSFDASGNFSFSTGLPLNGSTDGKHTIEVQATDKAGNVSAPVSYSFTLDTIGPQVKVQLDSAFDVGNDHTNDAAVTLDGTTEPNTPVVLEPTGATVRSDPVTGDFSFNNVAVALGPNTFTVQATDKAGNVGTTQITVIRDQTGGTTLVEGTRFVTPYQFTFTVPSQPSELQFSYDALSFDPSTFIQDAFEASLTDANGNSLVLPISSSQDVFLNITDGQAPIVSPNAQLANGTVDVDLSHITPGTQATLTARLVNNYSDTGTTVHISDPQILAATMNTPIAATPAATPSVNPENIDFASLTDVTTSITSVYGETSLNQHSNVLFAGLAVQNSGTFPVDAPLVVVITNLSDPSIRVRDADGQTPDGSPYFVLSGSDLATGQSTGSRTLAFFDPNGIQFTYELEILGQLNRPPSFTTQPNTEALAGLPYVYQATATDPDNDTLTYALLTAPTGMSVDPASGKLTWSPQSSDIGNQAVLVQVDDGHGGTALQSYTVSTINAPPDRPPLFTSTPIVQANVDSAYSYQATATDPDQDPLSFSVTGPTGLSVDANTGLVQWTPTGAQLGIATVVLTVADGRGGTAVQTYSIDVLNEPGNEPPVITSSPVTQYTIPPASDSPAGTVSPGGIQLTLGDGETSNQTVSLSGLGGGALTLGNVAEGNIGTPGEKDVYTFTLTASSLLYFDALTDNSGLQWSLTGPAGTAVSNHSFVTSDADLPVGGGPVLALPAGPYTLTVSGSGAATGPYAFRLSDLATATPITVGSTVTDTLNPANSTNLYQFTANAGDQDTFSGQTPQGSGLIAWRLIDPYGNVLFDTTIGSTSTVTLRATGTFYLLLEGPITSTGTQPFSFSVQFQGNTPPNDSGTPLTLGTTVNGTLTTAGQKDAYVYTLTAYSQLYFDALINDNNLQWSLSGPPGTVVSNRFFVESDGATAGTNPVVLPLPAGTYVLTVSSFLATDTYAFRLLNLASATALMPGTAVQDTLNPANSTNMYEFSATAGQSFYFAGFTSDTSFANWRLIDPFGNVLFSTFFRNDGGRLDLTSTGTYTLLVEGNIAATGSLSYSFNVEPISDVTQALTLGSPVNASLATPGELDHYTFSLAASALLYFDALTNSANLQWSLTGPSGTVVNNAAFNTSGGGSPLSPLILPAGAYTLTVSGIGETTGAYAFNLSDLSTAAPLTPGTAVIATLNPADSTDTYQFDATAGDTFYFAHLTNSPAGWRLLDPFGNVVFKTSLFNDPGRLTLTATGPYTLLVEGAINATGTDSYSFNVLPVTDTTQPLSLGSVVTSNLAAPSEQDHYTFTLSANSLLYFDALTNNSNLQWSLIGPGGTVINNVAFTQSDAVNSGSNPLALPAGSYALTVSTAGQFSGAYSFRLSDLAAAPTLSLGGPFSDTLNPGNSTNLYQFNASAGQSFYFAHLSSSGIGNSIWRLIDPYGHTLFSTGLGTDAGRLSLEAGGAYTLLVEGSIVNTGTINYSIEVAPITDTTQALQLGSLVNSSLATYGEQDNYTFSLSSSALLYFDALTNNSNLQWSLTGPAGAAVTNRAFTQSDSGSVINPVLSLPAGAYTLTVSGTGQTSGAYSLRLSNLASAPALTPGTAFSDTLNPADSTNFYQFNADAGDQYAYEHLAGSGAPDAVVRLIDPYGNVALRTPIASNAGPVTVAATGTYYLLVEGSIADTGTGTYTINLPFLGNVPPNPTGTPLTLGSTVTGTLATPGQQDQYVFTLANTTLAYFDAQTDNGNLLWSLNGPPGTVVNNLPFTSSDGRFASNNPVRVLPAGTYTLTVSATGQNTGSYAFRLSDLSTAPALTPGTAVSDTLNPANSTNFYQFTATAGQAFYFQELSDNGGSAGDGWRLIDSYGNNVFNVPLSLDAGRVSLTAGGTYTLLVEGFIADTGTTAYSFNVIPITDTAQTMTLGTTVNGNLAAPGQQDQYSFALAANGLLYFDALATSGQQWSLSGPSGIVVSNVSFIASDGTSAHVPVRAVPPGSYTLTVNASGATTGAYSFRLSDLANLTSPTPLTLGTPINDTLNPASSTNLYQFSGTAGESLYFEDISSGSVAADWRLIDPYGNVLFTSSLNADGGRVNLIATGTYTVLVEGSIQETGTVNYSIEVFAVTDTTQELTLGASTGGTLAAPSQRDNYTFTLAVASRLYFDSLTNNANFLWSLTGPGGTAVNNRSFAQSDALNGPADPALELPAGPYTLTVTGTAGATGAYAFELFDLAATAPVTINTPVLGKLSPGNSTNLYQFTAQAGQAFYFASNDVAFTLAGGNYLWRLLDPYDNVLFKTILGSDAGLVTLPTSGTYTLLIEGAISNSDNNGYTFNVEQPGVQVVPSQAGVPFSNLTGAVADLTQASFQVQLQGNGQAQVYDLLFEAPATGNQLGSIPVSIDAQYLYQVRAADADGDTLSYQLTQAPAGMQIDPTSGLITWVPTAAQVGPNSVTVQVEDGRGGIDTQSFVVTVLNTAPGGIAGTVYDDQNGDGSRTSVGNSVPPGGPFQAIGTPFPAIGSDSEPAFLVTIGAGGVITTNQTGQGPYDGSDDTYLAIVNEPDSGVAVESLEMSGNDDIFGFEGDGITSFVPHSGNAGANVTGYEGPGTYYSDYNAAGSGLPLNIGKVNFDDGQGNGLQPGQETYFSLEGVPTSITADIVTQVAPVTIEPALPGFTIYLDLNHDGKLDPGDPSTLTDALGHYSFSNLAPGTYTVAEVGQAGFKETEPANGAYTAVVQSGQVTSNLDFGNEPVSTNPRPPAITSTAPATAATGLPYEYDVTVSNPDGVSLQFDLPVKPDGMAIDPITGVIAWTPTEAEVGPQDVIVRLKDSRGEVILQHFVIDVRLQAPPVITSTPPSPAVSGLLYQYQVVAQDADNNPLSYTLLQGPAGMTIDSGTGLLSWVGAPLGPGLPSSFQVSLQVSDGQGGQDTQTYTLFVVTTSANSAPVITSSPSTTVGLGHVYLYNVVATDPNGLPLTYSLPTAPAGMTIDANGLIRWTPAENEFGPNAVTLRVDNGQGGVAQQSFTVQVAAEPNNLPPQITSHPPLAATLGRQYVYNLTGVDPDNTVLIWSLDASPDGMTIDPMQGFLRWTPTAEQLGNQNVTVRLTNGEGLDVAQSFAITVRALDVPPLITSTPPTQAAVGKEYAYPVATSDAEGNPLTFALTGGPLGMTIDSVTGQVQWLPLADQVGSQNVAIEVDDGQGGQATQTWTIVVSAQPPEQPPAITSTPDFEATVQLPYTYQVTATNPENGTLQYSLPVAPSGMTIDPSSGLIQWTPAAGQLGLNVALVAVTDGQGGVATQGFTITVRPPNQPPVIKSTPITTVTAGASYEYDVMAVDPDGDPLTYTLTTAPAGMTIDSLGRITWSPQISDIGNQPVDVSVSDGRGSNDSQQFTVVVVADTQSPEVILNVSANPADIGTPVMAVVSATDNVGVTSMSLTLNGNPVVLDSLGRATIPTTTVGSFTLVATASDAAGNVGTDSQTLVVINPQVTDAPLVALTTPADGDTVTAPTQVIGTVQDPNLVSYTLSLAPVGSDSFTTFFTGTSQVTDGVLGTLDPTMLQNDTYDLRLTATNAGGLVSTADVTVNVAQNLKLGNFTLAFTDLSIPVAGIPIMVIRTYDTLNANQSDDFGFGWSLGFRDVDLRTSVAKTGSEADGFFNPFKENSKVYLTLPGGQREGFTFQPKVADGLRGSFIGIFEPTFVPDPGVTDSLTVAPADLRVDDDGNFYDFETGIPYNPADPIFSGSYLLTTKDGLAYSIDGISGQLTEISDSNNNTLTFSSTGVQSSTGIGITFERDAQGRIAAIVDPIGNRIGYQYDGNGDLVAVTDRTHNTTQFVYLATPAHYLDQVIDPLGRTGTRVNYDASGRFVDIVDASGNSIQFTYDPTDLLASVTDQLGNKIVELYDARGNIISQTDALGDVTLQTFDANNDLLTQTDPLGRVTSFTYDARGDALTQTDPLGNVTISTYAQFTFGATALAASRGQAAAPFSRLQTMTDALGDTTSFQYDFFGNLGSAMDPDGNTSAFTTVAGNPGSITDGDGNTTQYLYDGSGQLIAQQDALGNVTTFTYDVNGDQTGQTSSQTAADGTVQLVTTQTQYDAQGRVIAVTDPEGGVSRTEYDALGNKTATIDALGRRTQYIYDAQNRLIETIYPDDTKTQSQYDAAGHLIASVDEQGRTTSYEYDAAGRLIKTTYPDGSSTQTEYDAAGEVTAKIDQLGNRTEYTYDADGRQISVRDPLGDLTTTTYDAAGRDIASTDPLGHTTRYVYDASGLRVGTDYPDGTKTTRTFDGRGQVISETDQLGRTTDYQYDADGRLTSVVDALGGRTQYGYDEAGHLISETDADGHTTTYEYDLLGRQTAIDLPALPGQAPYRSTTTYDAVGNVLSTTDDNGNTITFAYDTHNRLLAKDYPDGTSVIFTYTPTGQVASVTDTRGTTQYVYDARDRLLSSTQPDGTEISYLFDAAGDRTALTTPAGITTYTFDALGRELTVTDPEGGVTRYTYDADGNLIRTDLPNGVEETRNYDVLDRLTFLEDTDSTGNVLASYSYTLGPTGLRDVVVENTGRTVDYTYDALDRLTQEKITDAVFGNRTIDYTYDAVSNRLTMDDSIGGLTSYAYDAMNRLTTSTLDGVSTDYTYDKNGNLLSQLSPTEAAFYNWDFDNRLISADTNGDGTIDEVNVYDAAGNRVSQTIGTQVTRFLIDTVQQYAQVVMEYRPGGQIIASYVYGNSMISQERSGVQSFYLADALGSTRLLTNAAGLVTDRYIYDAFGRILAQSGSTINTYLFAGQQRDATLGMDYLRARFLEFNTGTFASADSFLGVTRSPLSLNRYAYAQQDPTNFTDPGGHFIGALFSALSNAIDEAVDAAESAVFYKSILEDITGVETILFLGTFAFRVASSLFDGFTSSFVIFENSAPTGGTVSTPIESAEFKLNVNKLNNMEQDVSAELEMKFTSGNHFDFVLGIRPTVSVQVSFGQELDIPIFSISYGPVKVFDLQLEIYPNWVPTPGIEFDLEGAFGPGGFLKAKLTLLTINFTGSDKGAHFGNG
jgi:RHS repeat-associated protein